MVLLKEMSPLQSHAFLLGTGWAFGRIVYRHGIPLQHSFVDSPVPHPLIRCPLKGHMMKRALMCRFSYAGNDPLRDFAGAGSSILSLLVQTLFCRQRSAAPRLHPLLRQVSFHSQTCKMCRLQGSRDLQKLRLAL